MKSIMIAAAAALSLATATPVAAQEMKPQDTADMQCLAVVAYLGGQMDAASPDMAGMAAGMMYYLGRLEGRSPSVNWLTRLEAYLEQADVGDIEAHAQRCGAELTEKGAALVAWGESVDGE